MVLEITQIWFNESDYATLDSLIRIMTEKGAKMMQKYGINGFKLSLCGTCQKSAITSSP